MSIVIPEREGAEHALAALEQTAHPDLEVLVEPGEGSFHPALLANSGAERAGGDYLAFLGEDVTLADPNWVERLLLYAGVPGVGAVGPTLTHPDGEAAASGIAIGLYDPAVPVMRGFPVDADGYYGSLACAREVSAVGMDCMLVRRELFEALGGFERAYRRQFHDFDLCLRLAERGLTTICAPEPRAVTHVTEARLRSDFDVLDRALFVDRWYERLEVGDPFYNRGFFRAAADYTPSPFGGDELELAMGEAAR